MFAQTDRAMRMSLLENLPNFIDHLAPKLLAQSVFPPVVSTDGMRRAEPSTPFGGLRRAVWSFCRAHP